MPLKAGTVIRNKLAGTMAEAMDEAFLREWNAGSDYPLSSQGQRERQILFSAIAQGVVKHLMENRDAFKIVVAVDQVDSVGSPIESENAQDIPVERDQSGPAGAAFDGLEVKRGTAVLSQVSGPIASAGTGAVEVIEVDEEAMS